jgi:hypothetical protein
MRAFDRDLIRGGHYGQRSCEPRKQAEHMAATDQPHREENPCQQGAVHTWHFCDTERYDQKGSFEFRSGYQYPSRPSRHGIVVKKRDVSAT